MASDEAKLVRRATGGNAEAFAELVRRYRDAVYGYCYHRTGSFEDARDLAQDAFVRAYTCLHQLRDPGRFGGWVRRIAANLCTRWAESRREIAVECIEHPCQVPESLNAAVVREALSTLPENERLAVVLHYVNGYSYGDIADFLEVSKGAVRGRLARGREMLKTEVLRMTRETFESNKLDEEFVIEAVKNALQEAQDAYNLLGDKAQSRKKVEEAASLIAGMETDQVSDPVALGHALLYLGSREFILGDRDRARERWARAKTLFEQAGDQDGIESWREALAYERLSMGNLAEAHDLYSQLADYWLSRRYEGSYTRGCNFLAAARALESMGLDTEHGKIASFLAGSGGFKREEGQTMHWVWVALGFNKESYPARLRNMPGPQPGPAPLPLVLIRNQPVVGDTLRFVDKDSRAEESVLESLSDKVTTPAGAFENCARSSSKLFASKTWEGDVVGTRRLWIAPGIGIVRIEFESTGGPTDTSELAAYAVSPSDDYIPLAVGNWWKWRWIKGEEEFGFSTESYRGIIAEENGTYVVVQYSFCVAP